jgi:hypothetical protein
MKFIKNLFEKIKKFLTPIEHFTWDDYERIEAKKIKIERDHYEH